MCIRDSTSVDKTAAPNENPAKLGLHKSELVKVCLSAIADILYRVPLYRSVPIYENSLSSSTPEDAVFNNYFPPPPLFPPPPPSWNGDTNAILREAIFISIDSQETVSVHSTRVCTGLLYYIGTLTQFCLLLVHGQVTIIMVALCNRADHYIFILFLSFFLSSFFFFSSPNLSSRRLDVYHTLAHGVVLV